MDGVKSVAPVYGNIERKDGEGQEKAADDDPMGLESAFDQTGPVCPDVPLDDDPLGLDAAFDVAVPCAAGGASDTESEEERARKHFQAQLDADAVLPPTQAFPEQCD